MVHANDGSKFLRAWDISNSPCSRDREGCLGRRCVFHTGRRVDGQPKGYALDIPAMSYEVLTELPENLAVLLARPYGAAFRNARSWFTVLADEEAVRTFVPDLIAIAALHPLSFVITAPGVSYDFVSRHFAPGAGIPEDSVTGSTHAALVPYWSQRLGKRELSAYQCSKRGGFLDCALRGDEVRIVGNAVTYLKGKIYVE